MRFLSGWKRRLPKRANRPPHGRSQRDLPTASLSIETLEARLTPSTATILKDINPGAASSSPHGGVNDNGVFVFAANDGSKGNELWMSDGTNGGTVVAANINPTGASDPQDLTIFNGEVFFSATDGTHGRELWQFDPTGDSATMVADINPGAADSDPQNLTAIGGQLFFSADDGSHGRELWVSDGTLGGTQLVKDINPGTAGSNPSNIVSFDGRVFFVANDGTNGSGIWQTDGTPANTQRFAAVLSGASYTNPGQLTPVNSSLFFTATTAASGTELWKTFGDTPAVMVADINPGAQGSNPTDLTDVQDQTLFFSANDGTHGQELWKYDTTTNVASMVADVNAGAAGSFPADITDLFGTVLFIADDGNHGAQLWTTDGTTNGTQIVEIINPNGDAFQRLPGNQFDGDITISGGVALFSANDGVHGFEPWVSDGLTDGSGTYMLTDINPGSASSLPSDFTDVSGAVFFAANNGFSGVEPFTSPLAPRDTPSTTFTSNPATANSAAPVTLSIKVTGVGSTVPTGVVKFFDSDGDFLGQATLDATGAASLTSTTLEVGSNYLLFATYEGDNNYTGLTDNTTQTVSQVGATTLTTLTASVNPATVGQPVNLIASIRAAAGAPSGTVEFFDGTTSLGSASVASGNLTATLPVIFSTSGSHALAAVYDGTVSFTNSRSSLSLPVNAAPLLSTSTSLETSANPITAGTTLTLTAFVTAPSQLPTGFVQFLDGSTPIGSALIDSSGNATLDVSNLSVGAHTLNAVYGGSARMATSSGSTSEAVYPATATGTTTTVTGTPNPSNIGQQVTFTANVTSTVGIPPGGTVTFTDGSTVLGSAIAIDGSGNASVSTTALANGPQTITATYSGSMTFNASVGTTTQTVGTTATTTSVTGTPNPSNVGQAVTFTALVTATSGTPTGSVTFSESGANLGSGTLDNTGHAFVSVSSLSAGPHTITATYAANGNFAGSSGTTTQTVSQSAIVTTTSVTGTPNPSAVGQAVTFTALVTATSGTPTGSVTFSESGANLGSGTLDNTGHAFVSVSSLSAGPHTITATYAANGNFAGSSGTTTQTVSQSAIVTTTSVTGTPNPSAVGQAVTFTALVTATSGTPTGSVTFSESGANLGSGTLDNTGHAFVSVSSLSAGPHTITATYAANGNFAGSSGTTTQTVSQSAIVTTTSVTGTPNPSAVGQAVTFTALVTATSGTPTGSVTFSESGANLGSGTLDNTGHAFVSVSSLSAGPHTITATYAANGNFAGSSGTTTQTVSQSAIVTTTSVTGTPNPSAVGQAVTFTALVTATSGTPTGSVTFSESGANLGSGTLDNTGHAFVSVSSLSAGPHTITATYAANGNFAGSSGTTTQTVSQSAIVTTTSVTGTPNPSAVGQAVTFTALVTATSGTPTGSVTFSESGANLGSGTLDNTGHAFVSVSTLSAGPHTITATYAASGNFAGSSGTTTQNVNQSTIATTTSVTGAPNPSNPNQPVTFTATVTSTSGTPTGSVTFSEGAATLGSGTLDNTGHAFISIATLAVGPHTITAAYAASGNFAASSGTTTQNVGAVQTTTSVTGTPNPSILGQSVTFTATVAASTGTPTGSVTFTDGATNLGVIALDNTGQASVTVSTLAFGPHTIIASYGANASFAASSGSTAQTVTHGPQTTTTTVTGTPNPAPVGQPVTFTATVTAPGGFAAGSVTFAEGATTLGSATLDNTGHAFINVSTLAVGPHTITASYAATAEFTASSATTTQTIHAVTAPTTTTVASSVNPSAPGEPVTFTAAVTAASGTPIGTVSFFAGSTLLDTGTLDDTGHASIAVATLPAGTHTILANYSGTDAFDASVGAVSQTVGSQTTTPTTTSVSASPNPSTTGQLVTFTATVASTGGTPTGSVTFADGSAILGVETLNAAGHAALSTAMLAQGAHSVTASYVGSATFASSTGSVTQTVSTSVTPGETPNQHWVSQLYVDLMGRAGESSGIDFWAAKVNNGASRVIVANQFEATPEYVTIVINRVYQETLLRKPDSLGFANSQAILAATGSARAVQAALQGSPEYFLVRSQLNQAAFLNDIYADSLGRLPGPTTAAFLLPQLVAGYPHLTLSKYVASSTEASARFVETAFQQYLGRAVDLPSLQNFVDFLTRGGRDDQVIAQILGSDEYFNAAQTGR